MSTIKPKLHTNKLLSDGSYSVKLYIYDNIEERPYWFPLGYSCKRKEWEEDSGCFRRNYPNYKTKNLILKQKELQAHEIFDDFILKGERFDYQVFRDRMQGLKKQKVKLLDFYDKIISDLTEQGIRDSKKARSCKVWKETRNLLVRFLKQSNKPKNPTFLQVDSAFLYDLETYMRSRGNKENTLRNRFANIKRAWNLAKNQGYADKDKYPFGEGKYKMGKQIKSKKDEVNPLNEIEIEAWKNLDVDSRLGRTKMLCLASYYLNGSNFIDLLLLKKSKNIKGDRISFHRSKTGCLITIKITEELRKIFDYFDSDNDYIFNLLDERIHKTGQQIVNRNSKLQSQTNADIKKLALIIGKDSTGFTFYNFRDTFAHKLHKSSVDIRLIQQALGHSTIQQTLTYLSSFGVEEIDDLAKFL